MYRLLVPLTLLVLCHNALSVNVCELINPCLNNGTCTPTESDDDYVCVCPPKFTGIVCQSVLTDREPISNTTLTSTQSPVTKLENIEPTKTSSIKLTEICDIISPCLNEGICMPTNDTNGYVCVCPPPFGGRVCQSVTTSTSTTTTTSTITQTTQSASTTLTVGEFVTKFLKCKNRTETTNKKTKRKSVHICDLINPCLNNGTCSPIEGTDDYKCICPAKFFGIVCQSIESVNNVTEYVDLTTATMRAYTKTTIEASNNQTSSVPNIVNKKTENLKNNKTHICDLINPCLNEGVCTPTEGTNDYICICPPKFTGIVCQSVLTEHVNNSIAAHVNNTTDLKENHSNDDSSVSCKLTSCNNGLCMPKQTGHICLCLDGWEGRKCNIKISNKCESECENGGKCISGKCSCSSLYTGTGCTEISQKVSICSSNICHNGGTCYNLGSNRLKCVCKPSNYGQYCEKVY